MGIVFFSTEKKNHAYYYIRLSMRLCIITSSFLFSSSLEEHCIRIMNIRDRFPDSCFLLVEGVLPLFFQRRLQHIIPNLLVLSDPPIQNQDFWMLRHAIQHAILHFSHCDSLIRVCSSTNTESLSVEDLLSLPHNCFPIYHDRSGMDVFKILRAYWPDFLNLCDRALSESTRLSPDRFCLLHLLPNTRLLYRCK